MSLQSIYAGRSPSISHYIGELFSSSFRQLETRFVVLFDSALDYLDGQRDWQTLAGMSDRELKDIGLARSSVGDAKGDGYPLG